MNLYVYTDGASRGNPGDAGIAYVVYNDKLELIYEFSKYIGKTTNNVAEYMALLKALEKVKEFSPERVCFYLDSELVVKQMKGEYKIKNEKLMNIYRKVKVYTSYFDCIFEHIPRELNKIADKLAKDASYNIM
jgi:ribonuclease HI